MFPVNLTIHRHLHTNTYIAADVGHIEHTWGNFLVKTNKLNILASDWLQNH